MASSVGMFCVHFKFSGEIKNMRRNEEMRGKKPSRILELVEPSKNADSHSV